MTFELDQDDPWRGLIYEGVAKATFFIALDNGGINRSRPAEQWAREYNAFVTSSEGVHPFGTINDWLKTLSDDDLETLCAGEQSEIDAIAERGPNGVRDLLDNYFDNVC